MNTKKLLQTATIAAAVTVAVTGFMAPEANAAGKEKCYGVVKAGQNGCGDADGVHSCEAQATVDGSGKEWIALPSGVCESLVGGSLTPYDK